MQPQKPKTQTSPKPQTPPVQVHHRARTFFASLFGIIAVWLILASVITVWLNRTLTDTNTYVAVVAPLATKPAVQDFVAQKVTEQLIKNAPTPDLASGLLPASQVNQETVDQLKTALQPVIYANVLKVVSSPAFATTWKDVNQAAHTALVNQMTTGSDQLTLDLHPVVVDVVNQLKTTQLAPISDQITIEPNTGTLNLKNSGVSEVHRYYQDIQRGTIAIVVAAVLAVVLSVILSVHHAKTIRRILMGTGVMLVLLAASIEVPALVALKITDAATQQVVVVIVQSLLRNLQIAALVGGVVCIVASLGSKLYSTLRTKK